MSAPIVLTPEQIAAIEARHAAATPGPWVAVQEAGSDAWHCYTGHWVWHEPSGSTYWKREDAELMAHARTDIPALLTHARAQAAEIARLAQEIERLRTPIRLKALPEWAQGEKGE